MDQSIALADIRDFDSQEPHRVQRFVQTIGDALADIGFFAIKNHGIDANLIREAYKLAEAFFLLPEASKRQYERLELQGQRAYTSFGREQAKAASLPDLKEFWHVGRVDYDPQNSCDPYGDNIWPQELPDFRTTYTELYKQLEKCAMKVLQACALYLQEPIDRIAPMARNGHSILRIIHYPPVTRDTPAIRAAAHEDINLITLLCEASDAGLELLDHDGKWRAIHALQGHIIVDAADMLQNLTNGVFKSTTHRVVNPPDKHSRRFSMPFFCHPRSECDLTPMESCLARQGGKQLYPAITAGDYLQQRLKEIGLS